ncbi:MAG TPA: prepilin-type N-terminal cleavage/methylation domain-containing protein [Candidatus Hydrogenedentes bacterium]|nr:prepilin-type N-terminal cleavage/methylation domain-containing protein [Candidatus Hydrogenedentota bacterium]
MRNQGMTMLEVMFAMAIFTVIMGALFALMLGFTDTTEIRDIQATSYDEARRALSSILPDIRQASRMSINWAQLPGETISYRVPVDADGNGFAVDQSNKAELSQPRTLSRDANDVNRDGRSANQLVCSSGGVTRVLANDLSPDSEQPDASGVFGPAQDVNQNGQMDRGIWFEPFGQGLRITIQTQGTTRENRIIRSTFQEVVIPRN